MLLNTPINKTKFVVFNDYDFYVDNKKVSEDIFLKLTKKGSESRAESINSAKIHTSSLQDKLTWYDPLLEAQGLFTELTKIPSIWDKNYNVNNLTRFISRFGLPTGVDISEYRFERVLNHGMDFMEFNTLLEQFKEVFNIWIAIKKGDAKQINLYAKKYESTYKMHFKGDTAPLKDIDKAFYILTNELNKKQKEGYTFTFSNGKPQKIYTFTNLFEVAYFQLSSFIENQGEFKECKHCGALFPVTHESRIFCHNLPGKNNSICLNSYKQRVSRDKIKAVKLHDQGKDIVEITETINRKRDKFSKRTQQEVSSWIIKT